MRSAAEDMCGGPAVPNVLSDGDLFLASIAGEASDLRLQGANVPIGSLLMVRLEAERPDVAALLRNSRQDPYGLVAIPVETAELIRSSW